VIKKTVHSYSQAKPFTRSLIAALIGFVFYGGWAYFVQMGYGPVIAVKAFFTQGLISFGITLVLTHFMEVVFKCFDSKRVAFWVTSICTSLVVVIISFTINILAGTPEVVMTILPGSIMSAFYSFSYVKFLAGFK
jgi:hypothetical protein